MIPNDKIKPDPEPRRWRDRTKKYLKDNWKPITIGAGITTFTIVTVIVTKRVISPRYSYICSGGTNYIMHRPILKRSPVNYVTNMFGAPYNRLSRSVRCVETGHKTKSLVDMANDMGVSPSHISRHLNYPEMYPSVKNYTFEDLGYNLPNHGNWDLSRG